MRGEVQAGAIAYGGDDVGAVPRAALRKARVCVVRVPATGDIGRGEGVGEGRVSDERRGVVDDEVEERICHACRKIGSSGLAER